MAYGYTYEVDQNPWNPREWDNYSTLVLAHRRLDLANEVKFEFGEYSGWGEAERALIREHNPVILLPVYMYDHGGVDLATSIKPYWFHANWDAGRVGWLMVTRESIQKMQGWKRITAARKAQVLEYALNELKEYSAYVNGDVYLVDLYQKDEQDETWTLVEENINAYGSAGLEWFKTEYPGIVELDPDEIEEDEEEEVEA